MALQAGEIAKALDCRTLGNRDIEIHRIQPIEKAARDCVTFAVDSRALERALASDARVILGPADEIEKLPPGCLEQRCLILSPNPYADYGRMVAAFFHVQPDLPATYPSVPSEVSSSFSGTPFIHPSADVHESADIYPGAFIGPRVRVGAGARIYPGVTILDDAVIGDGCTVYPNVTVRESCIIGDRVIIQPGAVIGGDGFGFARDGDQGIKIPQIGRVVIGHDVEIGANVTIDRGALDDTVIGEGTKIDNLVHIAHNCVIGRGCIIVAQVGISGSVTVGDGCTFAGQTGVVGHVSIGSGTTVAARGVVTSDLPARSFVSGFPAKPHAEEKRIMAALRRLPEMVRFFRKMARSGDDQSNSAVDGE